MAVSDIWRMSAVEISSAVRAKALSALEVTQAHLDRIGSVNGDLNAIVQEFPDQALAAARAVDAAIADGRDPGEMAGVPVTIKVNIDQAGHATTNGLRLQEGLIAETDSPVVTNLCKAGAVIIGRTNTPAFSMRWFTNNSLNGMTLNPRHRGLTPGGSSGGASSAVASGMCPVGHGTDIAGSVRYPAYACGIHGLRPTLGRVAAFNASGPDRHIGAQLMAVSGPLARRIEDIAVSLRAMAAEDRRDPWWAGVPLDHGGFEKRAALCVNPDGMEVVPEVERALREAADRLQDRGWLVEEITCPDMRRAAQINEALWMTETQVGAGDAIKKEADADALFVFAQMTQRFEPLDAQMLLSVLQERAGIIREWEAFLQTYPLLLCPISAQLPFAQQEDVSSPEAFDAVYRAQLTQRALPVMGMPGLAVAMEPVGDTPVGVQLVAGRYREDILLAAGADIEAGGAPIEVAD